MIMLAMLESYELSEFLKQDVPKPEDPHQAALWERVNARIRSFIILNATPSVLGHIKHMTNAKAIWTHLASLFARVSPMKRVSLEVQMRTLDPSKSPSMRDQQASESSARGLEYGKGDIIRGYGHNSTVSFIGKVFQFLFVSDY